MTEPTRPTRPGDSLPGVVRTITQDQLADYADASGDRNPLHLDAAFAATTQFGGIVAHGMLTLAFIAEMMTAAFGAAWLESGNLKVRFRGAAHVGDRIEAWGKITREDNSSSLRMVTCDVGVRSLAAGQELITGTATVKLGGTGAAQAPKDE